MAGKKGFFESIGGSLSDNFGATFDIKPFLFIAFVLVVTAFIVIPSGAWVGLQIAGFLSPLWLPVFLFIVAKHLWVLSRRAIFIAKQEHVVLELLMPREVTKSPLAMETVFGGLHQGPGEGQWYAKYIQGGVRPWWSLEMVSEEGRLRFFVWTRKSLAQLVKTQFYAQYPNIQIIEAADYALCTECNVKEVNVWGCEFGLTQPDPYPIKTYVDYGLDKSPKEEEKIDPFSNLLEFLGQLKKGERIWIQILFRTTKKEKFGDKDWKKEGQELIKSIMDEAKGKSEDDEDGSRPLRLTEGQKDKIKAIERNTAKLGFDVGIRALYIAEKDNFNAYNINGLTAMWKQFSSEGLNGFKPVGGMTIFKGYPWEDIGERRRNAMREDLVDAYKRRSYFHAPYKETHFVLSTEELATIFHPPSSTVSVPTLPRIPSLTAEAPANLPT
jgi:hypothetical protein